MVPKTEGTEDGNTREEHKRKAESRALNFLGSKPRCSAEVAGHLERLGFSEETACDVISSLKKSGMINDREYAASFVEEMVGKGYGFRRVRWKLGKKGLGEEIAEEALALYPREQELERAMSAAEGVADARSETDPSRKKIRLYGYLLRRGFDPAAAMEASASLASVDTHSGRE